MTWHDPYFTERESPPNLNTGGYGGTDDRFKRRKKKQPLGFAPPPAKVKPAPRRKAK